MAHVSNLPCDGDGRCMVCKINPPEEETINCKMCVTPWHLDCLSARPQTLAEAAEWECPDCSDLVSSNAPPCAVASGSEPSAALVAAIRAIESDVSLSDHEKAVRRQKLLSGKGSESSDDKKEIDNGGGNDVLKLLSGSFNCSFCMQLPERPVTTPCGHNFCLKCFEKWVGQGKRTCAICRTSIPVKMASQPRINSSLVVAIRMAKMTRSNAASGPPKPYYSILNQNKPDKAYTTERAKKTGNANACSGRIFVSVPPDHFGPILAENDLERGMGVMVGETWEDRLECRQWGAHRPHVAGICGQSDYGAQSVALSGGYEDDEDHGEWFLYTGSGGRDLSGNKRTNKKQSFDQKFDKSNEALRVSCKKGYPVRVVRSHKEKRSAYAPEQGVRYDGVYRIEKCWRKPGIQGYKVCRYLFVRCDNDPAPWTSDEIGDRPRPLPVIKELKDASDVTERKGPPSWDYDEEKGCWLWKIPPPESRIKTDQRDAGDGTTPRVVRRKTQMMSANALLLKEFCCLICHKVMNLPLTTPCAHNFCKACLQNAFAGQTFIKERNCEGRRTLRAKKNVMKCPSCPNDISEYLQNAQVNRELMSVIESLQRETKEMEETAAKEEAADKDEKADVNEMEETAAKKEAADKDEKADINEMEETAAKEEAADKDEKADLNEMEETATKEVAADKEEKTDVNELVETAAKEQAAVNEMEETAAKEEAADKDEKADFNEMEETASKEETANKDEKADVNEMDETAAKEEVADKDEKADVNEMEETIAKKEVADKDEKADVNEMEETTAKEEAADKDEKADVNDEGKYRNKRKAEDVTDNDNLPNKKPREESDTRTDGGVNDLDSQIIKGDDVEMQENFKEEER